MKILNVITSVNPAGGGPIEGVKQVGQVLVEGGHTFEVASLDAPNDPWVAECPLTVFPLGPSRTSYAYSPHLVPWLRSNAQRYDAIIARGIWQFGSFGVWLALHKSETPYYVYTHGMLDPWFKVTYPLKHLKKSLYWPWGDYRVLRDARAVCFTCEEERVLARQSFSRYRCNEVVVNYGTSGPQGEADATREVFLIRFPELRSKRIVFFISRIHEKKGCDLLIEAFAKMTKRDSSLHLVIAGPDQMGWQGQLQALGERLGIADRISWPGMLTGDLKWGAFHAADVFMLPSHQENFGIVVAEALSCGLPVLISNKVNIWREIESDGAGLVDDDTVAGATRLLEKWLDMTHEERQDMRAKAQLCFRERFEIHKAALSLINVLKD